MKYKTQFEKDNESYITNDGYVVIDSFFPRLAYLKDLNKLLR